MSLFPHCENQDKSGDQFKTGDKLENYEIPDEIRRVCMYARGVRPPALLYSGGRHLPRKCLLSTC